MLKVDAGSLHALRELAPVVFPQAVQHPTARRIWRVAVGLGQHVRASRVVVVGLVLQRHRIHDKARLVEQGRVGSRRHRHVGVRWLTLGVELGGLGADVDQLVVFVAGA